MVQEQHLAFLQVKLSSAPDRLQHQASSLQHVFKYDDLALQGMALEQIPVTDMAQGVVAKGGDEGYEVAFMRSLLHWFKHEFFTWTNTPKCEHCGSTKTTGIGATQANQIEQSFGAGQVELAQCKDCGGTTRFPRYNDPGKLLETRQGRCGEWANCFTLCCRALGFEARHVHDWTDHVWTEIYSDTLGRWLHADSCEAALDCPLVYEQGWGKKLTYCLAFARDNVVDVTQRYSKKFNEVLTRRTQFSEQQLERVMSALNEFALERGLANLPSDVTDARRSTLKLRADAEVKEFAETWANTPKTDEQIGRTSGDKEWREQRGELGATSEAKARAIECSETGISSTGEKLDIDVKSSSINSSVMTDARQVHSNVAVPKDFDNLAISCRWKDQGFGNQKGRLWLVVKRGAEVICEQDCFGVAPHDFETRSRTFSRSDLKEPNADDVISLEFVVGGGGGHQLIVEDLKVAMAKKSAKAAAGAAAGNCSIDGQSQAAATSGGYPSCATPAPATDSSLKEEMQALVKKAFTELVASGLSPNEAGAKAIAQAKKEQLQVLTKKAFNNLTASGMSPNDAAIKALAQAQEQMK